jgi:hypothetical protein
MIVPRNRRFPPFLLVPCSWPWRRLPYICPATAQTQPTAPADQQNQGQAQSSPGVLTEEIKKPIAKLTTAIETAEKALQQLSELEDELGRSGSTSRRSWASPSKRRRTCGPSSPRCDRRSRSSAPCPARTRLRKARRSRRSRASHRAGHRVRRRHQGRRADLGARPPADRAHHGAQALAVHAQSAGTAAEPAVAGRLARLLQRDAGRSVAACTICSTTWSFWAATRRPS